MLVCCWLLTATRTENKNGGRSVLMKVIAVSPGLCYSLPYCSLCSSCCSCLFCPCCPCCPCCSCGCSCNGWHRQVHHAYAVVLPAHVFQHGRRDQDLLVAPTPYLGHARVNGHEEVVNVADKDAQEVCFDGVADEERKKE